MCSIAVSMKRTWSGRAGPRDVIDGFVAAH